MSGELLQRNSVQRYAEFTFAASWEEAKKRSSRVTKKQAIRLHSLAHHNPTHVVEVGCNLGGTSYLLACAAQRFTMIDPWDRDTEKRAMMNMKHLLHKTTVLSFRDHELYGRWHGEISFMFLDHDHGADSTYNSLIGWRCHMAKRAPVAVHDYLEPKWPGVKEGIMRAGIPIVETMEGMAICRWD